MFVRWEGKRELVCKLLNGEWRVMCSSLSISHSFYWLWRYRLLALFSNTAILPNSSTRARKLPYNKINRPDLHGVHSAGDKRVEFCKVEWKHVWTMSVNQNPSAHTHTHRHRHAPWWTFASLLVRLHSPLLWLWGLKLSLRKPSAETLKSRSKPLTTAYFPSSSIWKEKNSSFPLITQPCLGLRLSGTDSVVPVFHLVGQFWLSEYKTVFLPPM